MFGILRIEILVDRPELQATQPQVLDAVLQLLDSLPESMESSMQRDQAAGRPVELDALSGALIRRATKAGIPVPVTRRLVDELRSRSDPAVSSGRNRDG